MRPRFAEESHNYRYDRVEIPSSYKQTSSASDGYGRYRADGDTLRNKRPYQVDGPDVIGRQPTGSFA